MDRRRTILAALVEEYIRSAQPVGSRAIVERYDLPCSAATVRNELAILEETGFLFQPHTSAGRVPTDAGYRAFVDDVAGGRTGLTTAEVSSVGQRLMEHASEIDELMRDTAAILSRLTSYVAVVLSPAASHARIRKIDIVSLASRRALVVVITDAGTVLDRMLEFDEETAPQDLVAVARMLNEMLEGSHLDEVGEDRVPSRAGRLGVLAAKVLSVVAELVGEADRERVSQAGAAALLAQPEFAESSTLRPLMTLLEDGVAMLETLSDVMRERDVVVRIGHENPRDELGDVSVVAASYGDTSGEGIVGVIGPTRMDYPRAISAVRCVSRNLTDRLGER